MSPETAALIARMQARPKTLRVVTKYDNGKVHNHDVATQGQAENYAHLMKRKLGMDLIDRETNTTVRVISVEIVAL